MTQVYGIEAWLEGPI